MFSIGLLVGGISPNSKIVSILASILYFPMLIFSGATLPILILLVLTLICAGISLKCFKWE